MREYQQLALFNSAGSQLPVATSIDKLAITIPDIARRQLVAGSKEISKVTTQMIVCGIMYSSNHINQGLQGIVSEMKHANILTEKNNLESRINAAEEWLFTNDFLNEFYQALSLDKLAIPLVEPTYCIFLEYICYVMSDLKIQCVSRKQSSFSNESRTFLLIL